jgi:peptide/nickel transport system ATP-binding protein
LHSDFSLPFISHDLDVVHHLADRVLVFKEGRVVEAGETERVFGYPQHTYTRELMAASPSLRRSDASARRSFGTQPLSLLTSFSALDA